MACPLLSEQDIIEALRSTGGEMAAAAHLLGMSPRTLRRRLDSMRPVSLKPQPSADQLMQQQFEFNIIQKALDGDVRCSIFYLKHIGWGRDPVEPVLWNGYPQN